MPWARLPSAMAGVVAAAPVLALLLQPIVGPVYRSAWRGPLHVCNDASGVRHGRATRLPCAGENPAVGNYAGLILGTMMGPTIVFTIPVALSIIKQEDRPFLGAGILAGLITVPIGCIVGGLVMNLTPYKMDVLTILRNLIPVIIIAGLICVGLWFIRPK